MRRPRATFSAKPGRVLKATDKCCAGRGTRIGQPRLAVQDGGLLRQLLRHSEARYAPPRNEMVPIILVDRVTPKAGRAREKRRGNGRRPR